MLFGMDRVGPKLHYAATCLVSIGTAISMTWIISVNSWMQTPAGYTVTSAGKFEPANWLAVIFNPSFPFRLVHMGLACFLAVAFIVGGVGGYHLLRARAQRRAPSQATRVMFSMALWMAAIVAPIQILAGDTQGLNTLEHQPAKIAAMEGDFDGGRYQGEKLFGIPNMKTQHTDYAARDPVCRLADPHPSSVGPHPRPEGFPESRPALQPDPILHLPDHDRHRLRHGGAGLLEPVVPLPRHALRNALAAPPGRADGPDRLDRNHLRLDDHRDRPPALHRLRPAPDRRQRFADRPARCRHLVPGLHCCLFCRLRFRHLHPAADDEPAARGRRGRSPPATSRSAPPASIPARRRATRIWAIAISLMPPGRPNERRPAHARGRGRPAWLVFLDPRGLGHDAGDRRPALCPARRLRPRRRHPVRGRKGQRKPRRHGQLDRPRLGTATRPGSCSAALACSASFRSPIPSFSRRYTPSSS